MNILRNTLYAVFALVIAVTSGCARYPDSAPTTGKQLVLTMTVRGRINPIDSLTGKQRYYFFAIDNDDDALTYPQAWTDPTKGGNGWVTSDRADESIGLTSYVQYDATSPDGLVMAVLPGSNFLNSGSPQLPLRVELLDGGSTLSITLDFGQIATESIPADEIRQLNINFITTDSLSRSGDPTRQTDGLGPTGREAVSITTLTDGLRPPIYDEGDIPPVTDPDLDIVRATVEVRTVSSR